MSESPVRNASRFERLSGYLDADPDNLSLIGDAVDAAIAEGQYEPALLLIDRYGALAPLPPQMVNAAGLVALHQSRWQDAARLCTALLEQGQDEPSVRFNAAWAMAMSGRHEEALALLDDATVDVLPQAAALWVNLMHGRGEFDAAAQRAPALLERHPEARALNAAISTLAMDVGDMDLARRAATQAGDHPEAVTTHALLALGDGAAADEVGALFDGAIARNPELPRAWIGRGLNRLTHDPKQAAVDLDRGATLFGDHLGSWIAAGWAHLLAGDSGAAQERFERALALDDRFAEAQGSLAVLAILSGRVEEGERQARVARRLDPACASAALAMMLLAAGRGDEVRAKAIMEQALRQPLEQGGDSLGDYLARLAIGRNLARP